MTNALQARVDLPSPAVIAQSLDQTSKLSIEGNPYESLANLKPADQSIETVVEARAGEISSGTSTRSNGNITINGVPLADVLRAEKRVDIHAHLRREQSDLAVQCGLRRAPSPRHALGRPGRPKRAISVVLAHKLEPFLLDETRSLKNVAKLFQLPMGAVRTYMEWLGVTRKKGCSHSQ